MSDTFKLKKPVKPVKETEEIIIGDTNGQIKSLDISNINGHEIKDFDCYNVEELVTELKSIDFIQDPQLKDFTLSVNFDNEIIVTHQKRLTDKEYKEAMTQYELDLGEYERAYMEHEVARLEHELKSAKKRREEFNKNK